MFAGGERNKKYLARQCTIHWSTTRLFTCSMCSLGLRSIFYSVKPYVKVCYGVEHSKHLKCLVTGGI
jgi:hypothetical protein